MKFLFSLMLSLAMFLSPSVLAVGNETNIKFNINLSDNELAELMSDSIEGSIDSDDIEDADDMKDFMEGEFSELPDFVKKIILKKHNKEYSNSFSMMEGRSRGWGSERHSRTTSYRILYGLTHFLFILAIIFVGTYIGRIAWDKAGNRK
jgi:hypothetical protein